MKTPLVPLTGGVSQEHIKFRDPQKADECVNLVPDVKKGLYTRPGLKTKMVFNYTTSPEFTGNYFYSFQMSINGVETELVLNANVLEGYIKIYRASDGYLYAALNDSIVSDYLNNVTSYNDLRVVPYRDTIYIVNRNKQLAINFQSTSTTFVLNNSTGFPVKFELYLRYIAQQSSDPNDLVQVSDTYTLTLNDFINAGYNISNYNTTTDTEVDISAQLFHDMLTELLTQAQNAGVFPDIVPGTPPVLITKLNNKVTVAAQPGVVMVLSCETDPYVNNYFTVTISPDTKPSSSVFSSTSEVDTAISARKTLHYDLTQIELNQIITGFLWFSNGAESVAFFYDGSQTAYIKAPDGVNYIGYLNTQGAFTLDLHPKWYLKSFTVSDPVGSTNSVTIFYKWHSTNVNYIKQPDPSKTYTLADPTSIVLYEPDIILKFNNDGYLPKVVANLTNNFSGASLNKTQQPTGNTWKTAIDLSLDLYHVFVDSDKLDLTNFDSNIQINRPDSYTVQIKIPWYISYDLTAEPLTLDYTANTIVDSYQPSDLSEENTPLRIYQSNNTWIAEHIYIDVSFTLSNNTGTYINAQLLSQLLGAHIKDLLVYQNRLILLTEQGLLASQTNNFQRFVPEVFDVYSDSDPFDITFAASGDTLEFVLPFTDQLVVFGRHAQYSVFHNGVFSLTNVKIVPATTYDILPIRPVAAGAEVYFLAQSARSPNYAILKKFIVQPNTMIKTAYTVSPGLDQYIPSNITQLVYLNQLDMLIMSPDNSTELYIIKMTYQQDNSVQEAPFKWTFKYPIMSISKDVEGSQLYIYSIVDYGTGIYWETLNYIDEFDQDIVAQYRADVYDLTIYTAYPGQKIEHKFPIQFLYTLPINFPQFEQLGHIIVQEVDLMCLGETHCIMEFLIRGVSEQTHQADISSTEGSKILKKLLPYIRLEDLYSGEAKIHIYTTEGNNNNLNLLGVTLAYRTYPNRKWQGISL